MKQTIAFVLILIALSLGFLHGASRYREDAAQAPDAPPEANKPPPAPAPPKDRPQPPPAAKHEAPREALPDASEADITAARADLEAGDGALRRGDYAGAGTSYAGVEKRLGSVSSVVTAPLLKAAMRGAARARVLGALAATVQPNDFAAGDGLTTITFKPVGDTPGREQIVRITAVGEKSLTYKTASGAVLELPQSELSKPIEPCPKEKWRKLVARGLADRKDRIEPDNAFVLFRTAAYALENGMPDEAAPLLASALEKDRKGSLVAYFCDAAHRPSPADVQLARGNTGAEVAQATAPRGASGAPERVERGSEGASGRPASSDPILANPTYAAAMKRLDEAIEHYRHSFRGKDADAELKKALAIFDEVSASLESLRDTFPSSAELDDRTVELNQMRIDCHKRAAIGS